MKFSKNEVQPYIDRMVNSLPSRKDMLMFRERCVRYSHAILTASMIYQLIAMDIEPWTLRCVDKII